MSQLKQNYLNAKALCEDAYRTKALMLAPYDWMNDGDDQEVEAHEDEYIQYEMAAHDAAHVADAEAALRKAQDELIKWMLDIVGEKKKDAIDGVTAIQFLRERINKPNVRTTLTKLALDFSGV